LTFKVKTLGEYSQEILRQYFKGKSALQEMKIELIVSITEVV
jgi:hypothetical protein